MVIVVFRMRLNPGIGEEYQLRLDEIMGIALEDASGLRRVTTYAAEDGEFCYILEWDNEENVKSWRNHPAHLEAMSEGKEKFYATYNVQICKQLYSRTG